jgi:hypothetical protein
VRGIDFAACACWYVQIAVKEQEDDGFRLIDVWRDEEPA